MSVFQSINVPQLNAGEFNNPKYTRMIFDSLSQMNENIKYAIENIDDENITKKFIDDLTVRNLLITNGDNSIRANGDIGLAAYKGSKKKFGFDILTGDAFFGGDIIGGSVQSSNYSVNEYGTALLGMKIDLDDGSVNAPGFTYKNKLFHLQSEWIAGDSKHSLSINDDEFSVEYSYMDELQKYSKVQKGGFFATDNLTGFSSGYSASGIEITNGPGNYLFVVNAENMTYKGWRVINGEILNTFETDMKQWVTDNFAPETHNHDLLYAPLVHSHGNISVTFTTVDGKIITVTNGIITAVQ